MFEPYLIYVMVKIEYIMKNHVWGFSDLFYLQMVKTLNLTAFGLEIENNKYDQRDVLDMDNKIYLT